MNPIPELSIIVPILNEAAALPELFGMLSCQQGIQFELILSDGGSDDGTPERAAELASAVPFPVLLVPSGRGRGRQLNSGAAAAHGDVFLFLHADSFFAETLALASGLTFFADRLASRGDCLAAGRFALRFARSDSAPSFPYYYYESKARLDRPGCIHGDQGFMLSREFFHAIGPFAEDLEILEDDRLAEEIRRTGEWLLLPAEIHTSARRFEAEGLRERQTLNALLLNFSAIGWEDLLRSLPELYRQQDRTRRLSLYPFLLEIRRRLDRLPGPERRRLWLRTGGFVRANAWQLAFALQLRRSFRRGLPPSPGSAGFLRSFDSWFDRCTDHLPGRLGAAALTWLWFHLLLWGGRRSSPVADR